MLWCDVVSMWNSTMRMWSHTAVQCDVVSMWNSTMRMWSHTAVQSATSLSRTRRTWRSTCKFMAWTARDVATHVNSATNHLCACLASVNTPRRNTLMVQSHMSVRTVTAALCTDVHWPATCAGTRLWGHSLVRLVEQALNTSPTYRNTWRFISLSFSILLCSDLLLVFNTAFVSILPLITVIMCVFMLLLLAFVTGWLYNMAV